MRLSAARHVAVSIYDQKRSQKDALSLFAPMPTPFELLRIADLIRLAADTAQACSEMEPSDETEQVQAIALHIKSAAEELEEIGLRLAGRPTSLEH